MILLWLDQPEAAHLIDQLRDAEIMGENCSCLAIKDRLTAAIKRDRQLPPINTLPTLIMYWPNTKECLTYYSEAMAASILQAFKAVAQATPAALAPVDPPAPAHRDPSTDS